MLREAKSTMRFTFLFFQKVSASITSKYKGQIETSQVVVLNDGKDNNNNNNSNNVMEDDGNNDNNSKDTTTKHNNKKDKNESVSDLGCSFMMSRSPKHIDNHVSSILVDSFIGLDNKLDLS